MATARKGNPLFNQRFGVCVFPGHGGGFKTFYLSVNFVESFTVLANYYPTSTSCKRFAQQRLGLRLKDFIPGVIKNHGKLE